MYLQKPASLCIAEDTCQTYCTTTGHITDRQPATLVAAVSIRQAGAQRPVRHQNRAGLGLPGDPGGEEAEMPIPKKPELRCLAGLDAVRLLYQKKRVHPRKHDYSRPDLMLRCEQFGDPSVTGWGSHHVGARTAGPWMQNIPDRSSFGLGRIPP